MFDFMLPKVPQVEVKDLADSIKSKKDIVILDVRTPQEHVREKISGSINLPLDQIVKDIEKVITDKNKLVYVYCMSGSRSVFAVQAMVKLGYKNVFDVKSGMLAWRILNK